MLTLMLSFDRDALSDLALHFLNKMKIMVVKEIEREEIEFICKVGLHTSHKPLCLLGITTIHLLLSLIMLKISVTLF